MTFSYTDHRTLTPDDITTLERLITAYREYGGHPPSAEPIQGEWVLVIHSDVTDGMGKWLETEGVFKRHGSTQLASDGRTTHTEFVLMQFTEAGQALPDRVHARPLSAPSRPPPSPPAPPPSRAR